jgi:hypothetical protein
MVIVLDALDECGDRAALDELVSLLAEFNTLPSHFKIFFTCRPHDAAKRKFRDMLRTCILDLDKEPCDSVNHDLHLYIEDEIRQLTGDRADESWPPEDPEVRKLVRRCGVLFELGALRMRRIRDGPNIGNSYRDIFNMILKETDGTSTFREPELDTEYRRILSITYFHHTHHSQDLSNALANFQAVVGVLVTLLHPLSLKVLAALIEMKEQKMRMILRPLSSVIQFSTDTELVFFIMPVFENSCSIHNNVSLLISSATIPPALNTPMTVNGLLTCQLHIVAWLRRAFES